MKLGVFERFTMTGTSNHEGVTKTSHANKK